MTSSEFHLAVTLESETGLDTAMQIKDLEIAFPLVIYVHFHSMKLVSTTYCVGNRVICYCILPYEYLQIIHKLNSVLCGPMHAFPTK